MHEPLTVSHTRAVWSMDADKSIVEDGDHAKS